MKTSSFASQFETKKPNKDGRQQNNRDNGFQVIQDEQNAAEDFPSFYGNPSENDQTDCSVRNIIGP